MSGNDWLSTIFNSSLPFADRLRDVFNYQIQNNSIYREYCSIFGISEDSDIQPDSIPLLPIRAFQMKKIYAADKDPELIFKSSGTTGMQQSTHCVADAALYKTAIANAFYEHFPHDDYSTLCYMPGYTENPHSSLIWMASLLIQNDASGLSKFMDHSENPEKWIDEVINHGKKPVLFGAAFGLLDLLDGKKVSNGHHLEIIETGGMKTHRRELSKKDLRNMLSEGFGVDQKDIHSEYGMCELLSQMYAIGEEWFTTPHWLKVSIRNPKNPDEICKPGEEGKIGIIDLANIFSCPFLLTDDKGVMDDTGRFQVLGRWNSDNLRGCNFLIDRD